METNEQKHTPGPWEVQPSSNPKNGTAWRDIVSMGTEFTPSYVGEAQERDARLIAAAPELVKALRELLEIGTGGVIARHETGKPTWTALEAVASIARAALEKAEVM